jgi:hypothetical protein
MSSKANGLVREISVVLPTTTDVTRDTQNTIEMGWENVLRPSAACRHENDSAFRGIVTSLLKQVPAGRGICSQAEICNTYVVVGAPA